MYKNWATVRGVVTWTSECTSKNSDMEDSLRKYSQFNSLQLHSVSNNACFSLSNFARVPWTNYCITTVSRWSRDWFGSSRDTFVYSDSTCTWTCSGSVPLNLLLSQHTKGMVNLRPCTFAYNIRSAVHFKLSVCGFRSMQPFDQFIFIDSKTWKKG